MIPVGGIKVSELSEEVTRRLFEAFRLEIRCDRRTNVGRVPDHPRRCCHRGPAVGC